MYLGLLWALLLLTGSVVAKKRHELTVGYRWDSRDGHGRPIYTINDQSPGPLLAIEEGEELEVFVDNQLPVETTLHWHGIYQKDAPWNDGVPGVTQYSIHPRDNYTYRFSVNQQYGSYWYHGHFGPPLGDGLRGPIWVAPAAWRPRPYHLISNDAADVEAMRQAEREPHHVVLADWNADTMASLLVAYRDTGVAPSCSNSITFNGKGRTYCLPADELRRQGRDPLGCLPQPGQADFGNPVTCEPTEGELEVLEAKPGQRWMWLNLIHGGVHHDLHVSVDEHDMWVVAADGEFVVPQKVQTARLDLATRLSVLVRLDKQGSLGGNRDFALRAGSLRPEQLIQGQALLRYPGAEKEREFRGPASSRPWVDVDGSDSPGALGNVARLDESRLSPYPANPPPATADATLRFTLDRAGRTGWALHAPDGPHQAFRQQMAPLLWDTASRGPTTHNTGLRNGSVVDIVFVNGVANSTVATSPHPLHKHNHKAWIIGSGSGGFPWASVAEAMDAGRAGDFNLVDPPRRDGYSLGPRPGDWTVVRYRIFFPAVSMLHCHMIHHFAAGQQVILLEGAEDLPPIPEEVKHRVHASFQPQLRYGPLE